MGTRALPSTTEDILHQCPKFRILLVGNSGVGKSSLIHHAFNVDYSTVSDRERGVCDINKEITSSQNPLFVVHDSKGFEPGDISNLETVEKFLQERGQDAELKERVHAIWLCIQIPFAGGRVFEIGDERLLKLRLSVPIIIVFTKFDMLVSRQTQSMTDDELDKPRAEINALALTRADHAFKESCVNLLQRVGKNLPYAKVSAKPQHRNTLSDLINITQELVHHHVEGDVWIVSAMAQRASAQAKIESSIAVGMKRYWQGIASSTQFSGSSLQECLAIIHKDITSSWNFNDPDNLLDSEDFQKRMMILAQLVTPEASDLSAWFSQSLNTIQGIIGIGSTLASAIVPAVAGIGLSAIFIRWVSSVYKQTPEVLRCLMGYIIDLTLVMDLLFFDTLPLNPPRLLSMDQVDAALESYKNLDARKVHCQIREYVKESTFVQILQSNNAQQKVIDIIHEHQMGQ